MGKHVPSGNLFPTVRSRRPTEQRVYLSTERVYLPTNRLIEQRPFKRPPYVSIRRLHRTAT
ncbi:hypothetical protein V2W45_1390816 [Cenococcum geophilum]